MFYLPASGPGVFYCSHRHLRVQSRQLRHQVGPAWAGVGEWERRQEDLDHGAFLLEKPKPQPCSRGNSWFSLGLPQGRFTGVGAGRWLTCWAWLTLLFPSLILGCVSHLSPSCFTCSERSCKANSVPIYEGLLNLGLWVATVPLSCIPRF